MRGLKRLTALFFATLMLLGAVLLALPYLPLGGIARRLAAQLRGPAQGAGYRLGHAEATEMQRKSQLAAEIARAIKARRLTQQGAAELLCVDQSKVSRITRGQFRGVSEAKLLELVTKLGHDVKIVVGPVRRRAGKVELQFA